MFKAQSVLCVGCDTDSDTDSDRLSDRLTDDRLESSEFRKESEVEEFRVVPEYMYR